MLLVRRTARADVWMCAASLTCCSGVFAVTPTCHTHVTVAGDTLINLGQRYLERPLDWPALARVNHVRNPRRLPVGASLCIPVDLLRATPRSGVVLEVTGDAMAQWPASKGQTNRQEAVRKGLEVPPGMSLRTTPNGYVTVQLADGSIIKVQANTEARLDTSKQYVEAGFFSSIWSVLKGRVESLVTHMTGGEPRFQIKTPQATLGVRGTEFRVAIEEGRTLGETLTGAVAVQGGTRTELVHAGQGTVSAQGQGVTPPTPLPPPPDVSVLPKLHERVLVKLSLPPVPGASHYRVQVAEDADFQRVRGETVSPQPLLKLNDLADGDYYLRARSADSRGLESPDAITTFKLKARPEPPIPSGPAPKAKVRAKSVDLSWATHPEASHYRLQVARDAAFQDLAYEQLKLGDTQHNVALAAGDYYWRVATTGPKDDHGPWGDAQLVLMREPPPQPPPPKVSDATLSFALQGEPGQHFEFQVARDVAFSPLLAAMNSADGQVTIPRPDEGGTLYVRYRAIDEDGFIGPYTAPQLIALPACVRSTDGQCVKSGNQFLTTQP
jgi:hypothetical protein